MKTLVAADERRRGKKNEKHMRDIHPEKERKKERKTERMTEKGGNHYVQSFMTSTGRYGANGVSRKTIARHVLYKPVHFSLRNMIATNLAATVKSETRSRGDILRWVSLKHISRRFSDWTFVPFAPTQAALAVGQRLTRRPRRFSPWEGSSETSMAHMHRLTTQNLSLSENPSRTHICTRTHTRTAWHKARIKCLRMAVEKLPVRNPAVCVCVCVLARLLQRHHDPTARLTPGLWS